MKLSETQFKVIQIILGVLGGLAIWFTIALPYFFNIPYQQFQNSILGYLFLIVFVVIIIIQRTVEKRLGVRLKYFFRAYLSALIAGLLLFILFAVTNHISFFNS